MQKLTPGQLRGIAFPECHKKCRATEFFGVCECEAFCPEKFTKFGEPPNKKVATGAKCICPLCNQSHDPKLISGGPGSNGWHR